MKGRKNSMNHTFAICAYKESAYMEKCIKSLKNQTIKSNIILVTSTPNDFLEEISKKYNLPYFINKGEKGITQDWNYAYKMADTELVTIAHQDDVYLPEYAEHISKAVKGVKKPLIIFTDYAELRNEKPVYHNKLLKIKRIMLMPLRIRGLQKSKFVRRRILAFGCPICCPSVTYMKKNLPKKIFKPGFRSDEDWEAWEMLSKRQGSFVYLNEIQMYHRIHEESETSVILGDNARNEEDYIMFRKFWPVQIAKLLAKVYAKSEKSNEL